MKKASMLLFYMDGIHWTKFHSFILVNKKNLGRQVLDKLGDGWFLEMQRG